MIKSLLVAAAVTAFSEDSAASVTPLYEIIEAQSTQEPSPELEQTEPPPPQLPIFNILPQDPVSLDQQIIRDCQIQKDQFAPDVTVNPDFRLPACGPGA